MNEEIKREIFIMIENIDDLKLLRKIKFLLIGIINTKTKS